MQQLKYDLKKMIIDECEKEDIQPEDISDSVELFSDASGLELDSIDALQISMGLQNKYGIRVADPKEFRRILVSIDTLAKYINEQKN